MPKSGLRMFTWRHQVEVRNLCLPHWVTGISQASSENTVQGSPTPQSQVVYRECAKEAPYTNNPQSPTPQLLNSLLTIAAANGVLPEILTKIQPLGITPPEIATPVQEVQKTVSVAPMQQYVHETVRNAPQMVPATSHTKPGPPLQFSPVHPTTIPPEVPPLVISPGLNQITQQNNPFIPPIQQFVQPPPPLLHPQPKEEMCNCAEPIVMSGQVPIGPEVLPMVNAPIEFTRSLANEPMYANSILTTGNGQTIPVNLQISIPPPNVEAPRITFINAALPTPPTETYSSAQINPYSYCNWCPYVYPQLSPPQQIIVKKKKSSLKEWLPLIILAMFNNDRGSCNNGGCCRSCKSGRSNIPVPFPIPIPTNNPIINAGSSHHRSSRKRGRNSDEDEDDWLE
ncbi:hypothetical protein RR48_10937 [Papilio machaon]|uniref:Uncharacterized protein n=1 Tax=Papilio machaon TaxID=76193 RepID=A0A194R7E8_PAPMA|nr:hypothetical protein RR48_10937 [Papilio machaon]